MIVGGTRANIIIAFAIFLFIPAYSGLDQPVDAGSGGRAGDCRYVLARRSKRCTVK